MSKILKKIAILCGIFIYIINPIFLDFDSGFWYVFAILLYPGFCTYLHLKGDVETTIGDILMAIATYILIVVVNFVIISFGERFINSWRIEWGPSIVRKCSVKDFGPEGNHTKGYRAQVFSYDGRDSSFAKVHLGGEPQIGDMVYVKWHYLRKRKEKHNIYSIIYNDSPTAKDFNTIGDFGFWEDKQFFTYHDFSLKEPELVYKEVGFNVCYKAARDTANAKDDTITLSFVDVCGKPRSIKYSPKNYAAVPNTFLIFHNINEEIDDRFIVCAPEVNTPENWAKISDYGYIFHYDVYSKEEIESQCPRIRGYVWQYKNRLSEKQKNDKPTEIPATQ